MTARTGEHARRPDRRFLIAAACALAAAFTLSACGTGQRAQTAIETPVVDGIGASVGSIAIRDLSVAPPPNGTYYSSATLQGVIINNGGSDDELVGVTTSAAGSVSLYSSVAAQTAGSASAAATSNVPAVTPVVTPTSASASASASGSSSASASTAPAPTTTGTLTIAAGGALMIGGTSTGAAVIQLNDLTAALAPSGLVTLTLTFKNAGSVTFQIAVHLTTKSVSPSILPSVITTAG